MTLKLSLVIITMNEAGLIEIMLNSVVGLPINEIIAVDSGSYDGTLDILKRFDAKIIGMEFKGSFADIRNRGIKEARNDWILSLDGDEELEPQAIDEISALDLSKDCYSFPRKNIIDGVWDRDAYPDPQTRLYKRSLSWIRHVHEVLIAYNSSAVLKSHILHYKSSEKAHKQNQRYTELIENTNIIPKLY